VIWNPLARCALLAALLCILPVAGRGEDKPEPESDGRGEYTHAYQFGANWFSQYIPDWDTRLAHLKGRENLRYLEIGPYEGRPFFWVLDHVLTHPSFRATAIDIFWADPAAAYEKGYEYRFRKNLGLSALSERVTVIKGSSQTELRKLPLESFDLIYIDGSHATGDVLTDAVLSWQLLKVGGIMIFDDYVWNPEWPFDITPRIAIDSFLTAYSGEIEEIARDVQLFVRKTTNLCHKIGYEGCSRLGSYIYDWRYRILFDTEAEAKVELTPKEVQVIERILRSRRFRLPGLVISDKLRSSPGFNRLNKKLGLGL